MKRNDNLEIEEILFTDEESSSLELPLSQRIFIIAVVFFGLIGFGVVLRVGHLAVVRAEIYEERSVVNANKARIIPAPRGIITDRYGEVLAENNQTFSVWIDVPKLLRTPGLLRNTIEEIAALARIETTTMADRVRIADFEKESVIKVIDDISVETAITLREKSIDGVQVIDDFKRIYADAEVFAHLVGYGNQVGLEGFYDTLLRGTDGREIVYRDAGLSILSTKNVEEPAPGLPLETTIDAELQRFFYSRLRGGLRDLGRTSGVGIAINPQNGDVLALVSLPSFDPDNLADYLNAPNQPFFNRAVSGEYNPGSTIKPLHALAALRESVVSPERQIFSSGFLEVPNPYDPDNPSVFLDWAPHGWVNIQSALARSSNVYFYHIGGGYDNEGITTQGLGIDRLNKYWRMFGLGQKTGIDIPVEGDGFLPNPDEKEERTNGDIWRLGDTYNVAIGQGDLLLTPIQLITMIAAVANDGVAYQPHVKKIDPRIQADYSNWQDDINIIKEGMEDAVRKPYGTARLISSVPMNIAGKTGSAQVANNTRTNAFFVGYGGAFDGDPEIAVLVLIEDALEGSLNAVPIARDVFQWYYESRLNISP